MLATAIVNQNIRHLLEQSFPCVQKASPDKPLGRFFANFTG